jgi:hypothetical protein
MSWRPASKKLCSRAFWIRKLGYKPVTKTDDLSYLRRTCHGILLWQGHSAGKCLDMLGFNTPLNIWIGTCSGNVGTSGTHGRGPKQVLLNPFLELSFKPVQLINNHNLASPSQNKFEQNVMWSLPKGFLNGFNRVQRCSFQNVVLRVSPAHPLSKNWPRSIKI